MENLKRGEAKGLDSHLHAMAYIILIGIIVVALFIALSFFIKENNFANNIFSSLFGSKSDLKGEFANKNPISDDGTLIENKTEENPKSEELASDSSPENFNVSKESPWIPSSVRQTESASDSSETVSSLGFLRIVNAITSNHTNNVYKLMHWEGADEEIDGYDRVYYAMPNPSGIITKIISKVNNQSLYKDFRPLNSTSTAYLELSLVSSSGGNVNLDSINELWLELPSPGYDFANKTLTMQQYNPNDSSASYTAYNVKDVIANNAGIITLPNISGTHASGVPYAYFKVMIS